MTQIRAAGIWELWAVATGSLMPSHSLLAQFGQPIAKRYRLINASFEVHPHLDAIYDSLEDALTDAAAWLASHASTAQAAIGVEVCTRSGEWRTLRQPAPLAA
jgi:hypothetical protein